MGVMVYFIFMGVKCRIYTINRTNATPGWAPFTRTRCRPSKGDGAGANFYRLLHTSSQNVCTSVSYLVV